MTRHDKDIDELMKRINAVDDEALRTSWANSPTKAALFQEITMHINSSEVRQREAKTSRKHRFLVILTAAIGVSTGIAGTAYAATSLLAPNAKHAQAVQQAAQIEAPAHLPGWRPELDAERVLCVADTAENSTLTYASKGPLDAALTAEDLTTPCLSNDDGTSFSRSETTVCVQDAATIFNVGGVSTTRQVPAIIGGNATCSQKGLAKADLPALLQSINQLRVHEVDILAATADPSACMTRQQAAAAVNAVLTSTGVGLKVRIFTEDEASIPCYDTSVDWTQGTVTVSPTRSMS